MSLGTTGTGASFPRLNTALSLALAAMLVAAPIPAGSNRPLFWVLWGVVVALLGSIYAVAMIRTHALPRFALEQVPVMRTLAATLIIYLAVQLVPFAPLLQAIGIPVSMLFGSIASPAISVAPGMTALVLLQWATYMLFFYLALQVAVNRERAHWLLHAIFYIISAHAAYALLALAQLGDPMLIFEKWAYEGAATGTFVNKNSFATFTAFGLVVGLSLMLRDAEARLRRRDYDPRVGRVTNWSAILINGVCLLTLGAALIASQSRAGLFAAAIGCLAALLIFAARRRSGERRGIILLALLVLVTGVGIVSLYGGGLLERVGSLDSSVDIRTELYQQVVGLIADRPWIGFGAGTFEAVFPYFHRLPVSPDLVWDKAHSTYLALWVEMGVIAGTIPLLIVAMMAWRLLKAALERARDWTLPLAGFSVIVVAAVHSIVDFSLEIQANVLIFLAIVALGLAGAFTPMKSAMQSRREPRIGGW